MLLWLEAQTLANAEEGTPREVHVGARPMDFPVHEERETEETVPEPGGGEACEESQQLIIFFVVRR